MKLLGWVIGYGSSFRGGDWLKHTPTLTTRHTTHNSLLTTFCVILIVMLCALLPSTAQVAEYYLDAVNGNDANPGTSEQLPWKTLGKAQSTVTGGDTVIVRNGSYGAYSESNKNRTDWVTYQAANGHMPVLSGISITNSPDILNTYLIFDGLKIESGGQVGIRPEKVRYLKLLNLTIEGGVDTQSYYYSNYPGIKLWQTCEDIVIDRCIIKSSEGENFQRIGYITGVYIQSGENITITNSDVSGASFGIIATGKNINIKNNNLHKLNSDGIIIGGCNGITIENNEIHDIIVYEPTIQEIPTETTWSDDGKTMTNSNAKWATAGDTLITTATAGMEVYVKSGNNVLTGDGERWGDAKSFTIASVSADGTQITLSKGIANGGQPSNVDYFIRSGVHADNIQMQASPGINNYNVILRGNRLYDNRGISKGSIDGGGQIMHLWPNNTSDPDGIGAHNVIIENNLFWCLYNNGDEEYAGRVNLRSMDGLVFRNNTVIGSVVVGWSSGRMNRNVTFLNNIIGYIDVEANAGFIKNDYNIMNHGFIKTPYLAGSHDTFFYPNSYSWDKWNDPAFTGIFADYANGDFRLASETSLGVGHGDPSNYPTTDILGNLRNDGAPDAGCYEYGATSSTVTGDINGDGSIDAVDLQLLINMILSGSFDSKADLNKDSSVDAIDLQALVNVILEG